LTGRDAEFHTIRELFHATAERRSPRMVVVSGPAGVGKTRLGWEFRKYVDGLAETIFWHQGRCLSYGDGIAFWALAEIVRQRFGIAEEDAADVAARKLAERLPEFIPAEAEQQYVGPRLARLLGVSYPDGGDAPLAREELFAGWRMFFERLADVSPTILLIEDAQHADPAVLDFLDHLVDWARTSPIYVVVLARPEIDFLRPGWGTGRNRTTLTLDPLDPRSMDALVDALVPGMPPQAVAAIAAHAQGNPLFAVETVRSLIDRDAVVPIDGVYRLVGDVGELSVPDSLHALLAARLDALDPQLRSLVADAAVLGTSFPAEALVAVSNSDADTVNAGLGRLLQRGVFEISADPLSPQRGAYRFSQNLLRQVAYETLARRDRKLRHLAVAAHLRNAFANDGEEVTDVVARHYLDAFAAVPDDADAADIRAQAIDALVRAAERSERSGAMSRAAESFAEAAELTGQTDAPESALAAAQLWERASSCAMSATDFDASLAHAERARAVYTELDKPRAAARAQVAICQAVRRLGRHTEARQPLNEALAFLRQDPDEDTVLAIMELATLEAFVGGAGAYDLAAEGLALGQALDVNSAMMVDLLITRGLSAGTTNRNVEAAADLEYAARLAERTGNVGGSSRALLNLSSIVLTTDPTAGAAAARASAEQSRQLGERLYLPVAVANLAASLLLIGSWDEAEQVLKYALEVDGYGEDVSVTSGYVAAYAVILSALRGDVEALPVDPLNLEPMRASEDGQDLAAGAVVDALLAMARGEPADALRHARAALDNASTVGVTNDWMLFAWPLAMRISMEMDDRRGADELLAMLDGYPVGHVPPLLRAERSFARARLRALDGDPDAAKALADAVDKIRAFGSPYHLAYALLGYADVLLAADPSSAEAAVLMDEVRSIATKLRVQPLLDRAKRSLAGEPA